MLRSEEMYRKKGSLHMINLVFGDSVSGSLKMMRYYARITNDKLIDPLEKIIRVQLCLDVGAVSDNGTGSERLKSLKDINDIYCLDERVLIGEQMFDEAVKCIKHMKELLQNGDDIRIWYSNEATEFCGFCWALSLLDSWGIQNDRIYYVKTPDNGFTENGEYCTYFGTDSFTPEELLAYSHMQQKLSESFKKFHIGQWDRAVKENANLRIVFNSRIIGVNEAFVDFIILKEAKKLEQIFNEAELIGNAMVNLGMSCYYLHSRIERMIKEGIFEKIAEGVFLRSILRKKQI